MAEGGTGSGSRPGPVIGCQAGAFSASRPATEVVSQPTPLDWATGPAFLGRVKTGLRQPEGSNACFSSYAQVRHIVRRRIDAALDARRAALVGCIAVCGPLQDHIDRRTAPKTRNSLAGTRNSLMPPGKNGSPVSAVSTSAALE